MPALRILAICLLLATTSFFSFSPRGFALDGNTLPPADRSLRLVDAVLWHSVSEEGRTLEGAIWDGQGNLLFCDNSTRRIVRVDRQGTESVIATLPSHAPGGLALHPDGRLFVCAIDMAKNEGVILALASDGSVETIVGAEKGFWPNDMVFDEDGGFYFTDFKGSPFERAGGVYHVTPDFKTITSFLPNMAQANGIGLSPDKRTLWVTEFATGLLYRIDLTGQARHSPIGANVAYRFSGPAPDSLRVDSEGNVYVAIYSQGRFLVLDRNGMPLASIQLPGREEGKNLLSTSLAVAPDAPICYLVSGNPPGGAGAHIFTCEALARGQSLPR